MSNFGLGSFLSFSCSLHVGIICRGQLSPALPPLAVPSPSGPTAAAAAALTVRAPRAPRRAAPGPTAAAVAPQRAAPGPRSHSVGHTEKHNSAKKMHEIIYTLVFVEA